MGERDGRGGISTFEGRRKKQVEREEEAYGRRWKTERWRRDNKRNPEIQKLNNTLGAAHKLKVNCCKNKR